MPVNARCAVMTGLNQPLEIMRLDIPDPGAGEVMIKVHSSGLCYTQIHEIKGENVSGTHFPNLLGHEGSGEVVAIGTGVTTVDVGDHVVMSWIKGSGINTVPKPVANGDVAINRGACTTFAECTVVSENRVTRIPDEMPLKPAALIGCAVATGMGMVFNNARVEPGSSVIVIGCGGIGMNAVHAASIAGATTIIAVDICDDKLSIAREFGATETVNAAGLTFGAELRERTGSGELDYAMDTVGRKDSMEFAYLAVKKTTGTTVLCGVPNPPGQTIEIDPFRLYYGQRLIGTSGGGVVPEVDYARFCEMYRVGVLKLDDMISHSVTLANINDGVAQLMKGHCIRVMIDMETF